MKHTVPDCIKFKKLCRRLYPDMDKDMRHVLVVGHLELLWHSTQSNAPAGDIGRYSDEEIAIEVRWPEEPEKLISALVECGWLDPCSLHRFVIHDWTDHCPNWVKGSLKRHNRPMVSAKEPTKEPTREPAKEPAKEGANSSVLGSDPSTLPPNVTKPNVTKPNQTKRRKERVKRASPPTLEEVKEYCLERSSSVDPDQFVDHYTANGWKQSNGNKICDWQAAVRTWERNGFSSSAAKSGTNENLKF